VPGLPFLSTRTLVSLRLPVRRLRLSACSLSGHGIYVMAELFVILDEIQTQAELFMGKRSAHGKKCS
jgi:hypothetical protein